MKKHEKTGGQLIIYSKNEMHDLTFWNTPLYPIQSILYFIKEKE